MVLGLALTIMVILNETQQPICDGDGRTWTEIDGFETQMEISLAINSLFNIINSLLVYKMYRFALTCQDASLHNSQL